MVRTGGAARYSLLDAKTELFELKTVKMKRLQTGFFFASRWQPFLLQQQLPPTATRVLDKENYILTREVTDREIEHTLRLLNSDKAPGPDGFPASFFKAYWPIIRKEVCDGIRSFFQSGQMPRKGIVKSFLYNTWRRSEKLI